MWKRIALWATAGVFVAWMAALTLAVAMAHGRANHAFELARLSGDPKASREIRAERFILVDRAGKRRGEWSTDSAGMAYLWLEHAGSARSIQLFSGDRLGSGLQIYEEGNPRASFDLTGNGPRMRLLDERDRDRIDLTVQPDGWARINVFGKEDGGGVNLSANPNGKANLAMFADYKINSKGDTQQDYRFGVAIGERGDTTLVMKEAGDSTSKIFFRIDGGGQPTAQIDRGSGQSFTLIPLDR